MEHDDRFRPQHAAQPAVRLPVERLEEAHRHMPAAACLRRVAGGAGRGRGAVDQPADRLVEHLDAEQRRIVAIPCSQPGQYVQREPDGLRTAVPTAHTGQSAVVVPVLRAGHGMQVDEDLESGGVGPVERTVEEPDAAGMPRHVAEDEIRHRDTHQVAAVRSDGTEIVERDVGLAMAAQETVEGVRRHGPVHPDLVGFAAGAEQPGRHPAFQHQPVAQIHPADRFVEAQRHPITSIPCNIPSHHRTPAPLRSGLDLTNPLTRYIYGL